MFQRFIDFIYATAKTGYSPMVSIHHCQKIITTNNMGIGVKGLTRWRYLLDNVELGDIDFSTHTGQIGSAVARGVEGEEEKVDFVKDMLRAVIEEIRGRNPNISEIFECSPCYPVAWKELGGTYHNPLHEREEFEQLIPEKEVRPVYQKGGCTLQGYRIKINDGDR